MRERLLTVHGIWAKGAWQEEVARVFAPHFDCISVKYPQYRMLGPLNLVLEPFGSAWAFAVGIAHLACF